MSGLRDVVFTLILAGLVPMSLLRPWLGILAWCWIAFMAPHGLTWGFARTLPVGILIGGATLVGFLVHRERQKLPRAAVVTFLLLFAVHITATSVFAMSPDLAWGKWNWVIKSLLMTFVMMCLFQDRARLRYLFLVVALSLGFYGLKGGLWVIRTGGAERVFGPDQSFFGDNNTLGLALCMVLPILLYLSREETRRWLRLTLRVVFAFTIVAVIFTYSRGAFIGLALVLGILAWRSPWRLRFAAALVLVALVAAPLAPQRLWDRVDELFRATSAETRDDSTVGRFEAWQTGWNIATTHPLMGGGFRVYWRDSVWKRFHEGHYLTNRDAHSLYFEVLGEHGFLGLGLYLSVVVLTLFHLRRLRRRWRGHPEHGYLSHYAEMIQLSFYPFLISGAFIGVAYFDLYFTLVGASVMLYTLGVRAERTEPQRRRRPPAPPRTLPARGPRRLPAAPVPAAAPASRMKHA